jgi:hypothetical protein
MSPSFFASPFPRFYPHVVDTMSDRRSILCFGGLGVDLRERRRGFRGLGGALRGVWNMIIPPTGGLHHDCACGIFWFKRDDAGF